jgi:hypothetical protein
MVVDQDLQEVEMEIEVEEEEIKCSVFDNDPLAVRWRVFFTAEAQRAQRSAED